MNGVYCELEKRRVRLLPPMVGKLLPRPPEKKWLGPVDEQASDRLRLPSSLGASLLAASNSKQPTKGTFFCWSVLFWRIARPRALIFLRSLVEVGEIWYYYCSVLTPTRGSSSKAAGTAVGGLGETAMGSDAGSEKSVKNKIYFH